ncbi:hypothetical protein AB0B30_32570 [Streptomyces narbonensis]|uniref:Uncharacterized protein n=1 Tax=Streptomyces narbonensis TaxID=67333 RepID=A0ABV3CIW6_9ACTN
MEDPTPWEAIRSIQAGVQRMEAAQALYVTQDQRASDKENQDLKLTALAKDQAEDRARLDSLTRNAWTALIAPLIVGVVLYFLLGGKT